MRKLRDIADTFFPAIMALGLVAREIVGWLMLGMGLFIFYICFMMLVADKPRIIAASPLAIIGFMVFRGGIHLLKVAAAAQVCLAARKPMPEKPAPALTEPARPPRPLVLKR